MIDTTSRRVEDRRPHVASATWLACDSHCWKGQDCGSADHAGMREAGRRLDG